MPPGKPRVALFVTCLVDVYRPSVAFASIKLLEEAGCQVEIPRAQTCCGQPAYNSGDRGTARELAEGILETFGGYDFIVVPSGSCGGMMKHHLPHLFDDDPDLRIKADSLAARTFEVVSFLTDVLGIDRVRRKSGIGSVTYHDSCSGLRELGIKAQPRRLLETAGARLTEMSEPETCCGFGGTFCVKYQDISVRMVSDKVRDIVATGAETVLAGDLGCLLNIAGRLQREKRGVVVRHVAEVLSGMDGQLPPIAVSDRGGSG